MHHFSLHTYNRLESIFERVYKLLFNILFSIPVIEGIYELPEMSALQPCRAKYVTRLMTTWGQFGIDIDQILFKFSIIPSPSLPSLHQANQVLVVHPRIHRRLLWTSPYINNLKFVMHICQGPLTSFQYILK